MNIGLFIFIIFECIIGVLSTAYLTIGLPAVIIWKFYRKIRYGISIMN